jgi:hypothetical protein
LRGPLPCPFKTRDWRGVCKKCLQDLERLGVRSRTLDNKEFVGLLNFEEDSADCSRLGNHLLI